MNLTARSFKPYSARAALYVLLVVLSVVFTMATALSVSDFLKILFGEQEGGGIPSVNVVARWLDEFYVWLIGFGRMNALLIFSAVLFLLYGLKNVFGYLAAVQIASIRSLIVRDLRRAMFRKAMYLPLSYYGRSRKGDVISRFSADMVEYEEGTLASLQSLLSAVISMGLYLGMLFYLNVKLTLFVLCMLPIVAFVISGLSRRLKRNSREVQEMSSRLISLTDETIGGLKIIKAYNAIDFSNTRFRKYNREYTHRRNNMYYHIEAASPLSDFLGNTIVVGILLFGSWLVMGGDNGLTADLFVSYVMLFVLMIPPAKELSTAVSQMRKGRACAERIDAFLSEEEEREGGMEEGKAELREDADVVELRDVCFSYTEGTPVLKDVTISVPRGKTVALVGSSGSGKSTIADLVCRFYEASSGDVLFEGCRVGDIPREVLRGKIGVVSQETLLFNDSVMANIAFGTEAATREEVEAAARAAQAHEFILSLPEGYDTCIGEGGALLSGGQRQRISIARAILRKPELLILDEATSALDTESEHRFQKALATVLKGRSALIIAHRLSTIASADKIVVLDGGRVVEEGDHSTLMRRGGRYAEMVSLQSF